jgi:hypothetical protein
MRVKPCSLLLVALLGFSSEASAVLLYASPQRNTDVPGSLTNRDTSHVPQGPEDQRRLLNSGWQFQGDFNGFLGTPIGPRHFITAAHIGGESNATNLFAFNGTTYTISTAGNFVDSPDTDLRIWRINETFPTWAPLYTDADELGKPLVVFGRGTQRGPEVRVNGVLKGWQWGSYDGVRSWGENVVSGFFDTVEEGDQRLLAFEFNAGAGPNESILSLGDSGGGVFIESDGLWKLAGVNAGVSGPWRLDQSGTPGPPFDAALFDAGGLWFGDSEPTFIDEAALDIPALSVASRIFTEMTWIQSVLSSTTPASVPEPGSAAVLAVSLMVLSRRRMGPVRDRRT